MVGEDLDDFDLYREQLRAELAPVGLAESLLVERIVGLFWRLQRAERFHTAAFDMVYLQCRSDPQNKRWQPIPGPDGADPLFGLTVMKDFSQTRILERLLGYERRLEGSLYRTMAELHKVQGQRQGAGGVPMAEDDRRGRRSHVVRDTHPTDLSRQEEDRRGPFHRCGRRSRRTSPWTTCWQRSPPWRKRLPAPRRTRRRTFRAKRTQFPSGRRRSKRRRSRFVVCPSGHILA